MQDFRKAITRLVTLLAIGFLGNQATAQLTTTPSTNATALVTQLVGPGITISNATLTGPANSAGTFNGTASNIGLPGGVLLTSGSVQNAPGPNVSGGITTASNAPGDAQLNVLTSPFTTEDACILEFDMVAKCDTIQISYVFGSDEYDEYVCSQFTDVFAFFISGPGITGVQNIAVVPGTSIPVSINTVNIGTVGAFSSFPLPSNCNTSNATYFTTNNVGTTVEYDGFTVPLIAKSHVIPCSTYHIKLAIADAGDDAFDSGVFLEQNGIRCTDAFFSVNSQLSNSSSSVAVEGCVNGLLTFHRDGDSTQALTLGYTVGGTATPGLDYPVLSGSVTFPANSGTVTIPIIPTVDGITEGTESIFVIISDTVCNIITHDTAYINIADPLDVDAGADRTICLGASSQLGAAAIPFVTYSWTPTTGLNNATLSNPTATPAATGTFTYFLTGLDSNQCSARDTVVLTVVPQPTASFTAPINVCLGSTATITYTGNAPGNATYTWNFGGGVVNSGSGQGPYVVHWTNAGSTTVSLQVTQGICTSTVATFNVTVGAPPLASLQGNAISCFGSGNGSITSTVLNGTPNFTYAWSNSASTPNLTNLGPGTYTLTVTDAIGCRDTVAVTLNQPLPLVLTNTLDQDISCNGAADGCAGVTYSGGNGNYSLLWSNGATSDTICNLAPGSYTVTLTDTSFTTSLGTVYYNETFDGAHGWTLNVPTGVNGIDDNFWVVNDNEGGVPPPGCGVASNGDATLHITSVACPTCGAAYDAGGLCGILFCPQTNMRAESPAFSTVGGNNLDLSFDFISMGDALIDNASVFYNDGGGWALLNASIKSTNCISGQGRWTQFTAALPPSCWNNPAVRVGVNWTNNDDGIGTDPSVAINNVLVAAPSSLVSTLCTATATTVITEPTPLTAALAVVDVLCNGDSTGCVTATAGGSNGNYSYLWSTGATTSQVCGLPAGTYIVTISDTSNVSNGTTGPVVLFNETFDGALNWNLNVPTGVNGLDPNFWVINDNEGGVIPPGCGVATNGDNTLHITSVFCPSCGAAYDAGGLCGILFCPETNSRAESPAFSTVGQNNLTLGFDYISMGDALLDNASVWYNAGSGWNLLNPSIKSVNCVSGQGQWTAFSAALPPATWNVPSLQIGINWTNNDDGAGADPSVAINNIRVTAPGTITGSPILCQRIDTLTITEPTPLQLGITGYDLTCFGSADGSAVVTHTGGTPTYTVQWSNSQTADSISGLAAGTYTVTVTDDNGCSDSATTTLSQPADIITNTSMTAVSCNGGTDGCAIVVASGGPSGIFSFLWSNGATNDTICGLAAGTYYVTVTDTTGGGGSFTTNVYSEDFDNSPPWTLNVPTGVNGLDPNFWIMNDDEGGVPPPGCGVASNGDATLHITSVFCPTCGAAYDAGGLCGILFCPETNARAESPLINTTGFNNLNLSFDFISMGDALLDNASVYYNDGSGWTLLNASIKSVNCVSGQGQWTAASMPLPPTTWNNPNLQIGFNWTNNDDGAGSDPSVAINNVLITSTTTLTGAANCTAIDSITVIEPAVLTVSLTRTNTFCGQPLGTATANAAGGNGGYTYDWNTTPAQTTQTATGLVAGTYTVTVTDVLGCTAIGSITVNDIPGPTISVNAITNVACFGGSTGSATATLNQGTAPITITWGTTPQQTGTTASNLPAGTYFVWATDSAGCVDSVQFTITQPTLLSMGVTTVGAICGLANGSATAIPNGGTFPYTYAWSTNQTGPSIGSLGAGSYSVTVTDANGCTATSNFTITQAGSPVLTQTGASPVNCFGGSDGSITVTASGGVGPYIYLWNTTPAQTNPAATNLPAGTWTVTVTDANGCQDHLSATITQPTPLTGTMVVTPNGCNNITSPNGTAGVIVSGSVPPYSYSWNTTPVQTGPYVTGLAPGNYSVTITDAHACTLVLSGTVVQQPSPTVSAGPDATFCEGEGGALIFANPSSGTPGYYFNWWCAIPACGLDSVNDNDPVANPTASQWYYVQVTDTNGCLSNIDSLFVTVLPKPIVDAGADLILCGDSAPCVVLNPTITGATGPYTYHWTPGVSMNDSTIMNPCVRPDTTTIYGLLVTAGNGCTSDFTFTDTVATVTVFVNPIPIAEAGPDRVLCFGDTIMLQGYGTGAGPNYTFEWTPETFLTDSSIANPLAFPPLTTDYTLVVWSNGCPSYADTVTVDVHTIPTVEAGWDREICPFDTTILDALAGGDSTATYTFHWSPGTGIIGSQNVEDAYAAPLQTTTYYVTALSNWGCESAPDSATVYVKPMPIAVAGPNLYICPGDTIQLQGSYYYTTPDSAPASQIYYSWTPSATVSDSTQIDPWVWPSVSTLYHLHMRYNTCSSDDSVLVTVGPVSLAQVLPDTTIICSRDSILLDASGSIGNDFTWIPATGLSDPNSLTPLASPDTTTTYTLVIGDGGCNDTTSFTLSVLPSPTADYLSSPTEGCAPFDVSFMETSSDEIAYVWDFGDNGPVSNIPQPVHTFTSPGTYQVSLTVAAPGGCTDEINTITVVVTDHAVAEFSTSPDFPVQMSFPNTNVVFTDLSVNASDWYWDFGDGTTSTEINPSHTYLAEGEYFVTLVVHSGGACEGEVTHGPFVVVSPDIFIPNVFSPNGDGINDDFFPQYTGDQPFTCKVYDRWGVTLWETTNKTHGWDGKNATGDDVVEGVYYYLLKAGNREFTGNVTLVR